MPLTAQESTRVWPRILANLSLAAALLLILAATSLPVWDYGVLLFACLLMVPPIISAVNAETSRPPKDPAERWSPTTQLRTLLIAVAAVAGLLALNVPFHARFAVSESSMTRDAEALLAGRKPVQTVGRIGGYPVYIAHAGGDFVYFTVSKSTTGTVSRDGGFAYSRNGVAPTPESTGLLLGSAKQFSDRWWRVQDESLVQSLYGR